jgi:signal transduction histidine kinase
MSRALAPLLAAAIGLAGAVAATLLLFRAGEAALDNVLDERLRGAGESAALGLGGSPLAGDRLQALQRANSLDAASLVDSSLTVIADAGGRTGQRADLLRIDADRVRHAFQGAGSVGPGYSLGKLDVRTGYFSVRGAGGSIESVLVFEAGESFLAARAELGHARNAAILLSLFSALALGVVAARWSAAEQTRQKAAEQAARGESIARMAAMVAHEVRTPLGVIRGTVELMREQAGSGLPAWQDERLGDLLAEVERMRRLSEDFLSLGKPDGPLANARVDLKELLSEAARGAEATFRQVQVRCEVAPGTPVVGDPGRLRQVFANLLANASQAQERGEIELTADAADGFAHVRVHDSGPGLPQMVRDRLFDPFVTTKAGGTGLGLAVARMLVERHGGTLAFVDDGRPGTTFEVRLPLAAA